MGAVSVLTPLLIAAWPSLVSAIASAAASLGFTMVEAGMKAMSPGGEAQQTAGAGPVTLEIGQSEVIGEHLGRDQSLRVTRDGVTIVFSRDARGHLALCVSGEGHARAELETLGQQMSERVLQTFVYQKLKTELQARSFMVVEEQTDAAQAIHLKVRLWEQ